MEYCHENYIITGKNKKYIVLSYSQVNAVFPMLYVASYNKLEQLHMQALLNSHFSHFCIVSSNSKNQPNNNLIILACVIALVHYS